MDRQQLIRQMVFRMTIFFLICIATGFILSDLNIHSQFAEKDIQNVQDYGRN